MKKILSKASKNWKSPEWWANVAIPYAIESVIQRYFYFRRKKNATNVLDETWDNLIILDGCRYDLFQEANTIPGDLSSRISVGTSTEEFLPETFADRTCHDTVYVTASPMYRIRKWVDMDLSETFHAIDDVWMWGWDDELRTVRPETMAEATLDAAQEYPNKRLIAHFMQPHYPFIGEKGQELSDHAGVENSRALAMESETESTRANVWTQLKNDELGVDEVWDAYRENLELALSSVERLVEQLEGRTVVTSDHGNMVGEFATPFPKRYYGHPKGLHTEELATVPWLYIDGEPQAVESEPPETATHKENTSSPRERLEDLGYI